MARNRVTKRKPEEDTHGNGAAAASDPEINSQDATSSTKDALESVSDENHRDENGHVDVLRASRKGGVESDASAVVSEDSDAGEPQDVTMNGIHMDALRDEAEEEEVEDEEDILVVVELADFKNHPILDDYQSITIEVRCLDDWLRTPRCR